MIRSHQIFNYFLKITSKIQYKYAWIEKWICEQRDPIRFPYSTNRDMIAINYLRPVLVAYWRFKTLFFPLIYYFNSISIMASKLLQLPAFIVSSFSKEEDQEPVIIREKEEEKGSSITGTFPLEIWERIARKGNLDMNNLLQVNSVFYHHFGDIRYKEFESVQLLLVLSTTKKMRMSDECFLKYGPDFPNRPYESYEIYERHQISSKYEYEFLDVKTSSRSYILTYEKSDSIIVSSKKDIDFFIDHILTNPNSRLKICIKNLCMDVSFLDGFGELITSKNSKIDQFLKEVSAQEEINCIQVDLPAVNVTECHDYFSGCRWQPYIQSYNSFSYFARDFDDFNGKFPRNVYYKELMPLSAIFEHYGINNRMSQIDFTTESQLLENHPFSRFISYFNDIPARFHYTKNIRKAALMSLSIDIIHREFLGEQDVEMGLRRYINLITSKEVCGDINSSFSILGMKDSKLEVAPADDYPRDNKLVEYEPQIILLNKPLIKATSDV
ncbi:hypothetical protein BN7_4586 [Wickerhamomyces ciferrii]|uniref:Uncharacterized protein n=1 Tax=Wickerhamomyces ciferrii (strain ATCC 14091 / BCRC 22168 / CBS 111 / JCM 3599 / NBRC 0793 / NRRL Y-1031 F-60-10) TaxID=1206466 RepID=K0KSI5_WICCF|nr:uncharacterized protein BN7_4586 [Wickerhamomyces ciferrii]CCH45007.1 hypothetical protein BN7_4586 [Wickerhamomyces ciferrii]